MGYTFVVGNAKPTHDKDDFPYLRARWEVDIKTLKSAPTFVNDEMTGNSNSRSPSYTVWAEFARATGLYEFFFDDRGHLHAGHPGCVGITQEDADLVTAALNRYKSKAVHPPGFSDWYGKTPDDKPVDAHLARLIWLEFWMQWAVKNCKTPAIQNW